MAGRLFGGPRTLKRRVAALGSRRGARARRLYGGGVFLVVVAGFASRPPPPDGFRWGGSSLARVVESGRHTTLKMWRSCGRAGSSPATGTVC